MNLYLIGYRGSGKSTVAPMIASQLGWKVVDVDDLIEAESKMSIAMIFEEFGEPEFRRRETESITRLAELGELVVSLGGGAPMTEANRELVSWSGKTVWLNADPDVLWQRISGDETTSQQRPDLTNQGGKAEVDLLLAIRAPVYKACADYTIDVGSLGPEEVAERIVNWWQADDKNSKPVEG